MTEHLTVYGAGYVGLVTGACLAGSGHAVTMVDVDAERIATLRAGECPIHEPGLKDLIAEGIAAERLVFLTSEEHVLADDLVFVAVGTPPTRSGAADLTFVRSVVAEVAASDVEHVLVVMKSTVPPSSGNRFAAELAARGHAYASNPEFLREGSAVTDWYRTDRIVLGGPDEAIARLRALYSDIDSPVLACDVTSAEMIKYASNAFLATKISFINEIAVLCDLTGATVDQVARGIGMDERIGASFLRAGIGYGGSCFPKDTRALDFIASVNGYDFHLLRAVIEVNARQRLLPVRALKAHFGSLEERRVAVLGLTFKPDTDDTREAPAVEIVDLLQAEGADVIGYNPIEVQLPNLANVSATLAEAIAGSDAVVLATEWDEIVAADWAALVPTMKQSAVVFDGRNALDSQTIRAAGGVYIGVGRPSGSRT